MTAAAPPTACLMLADGDVFFGRGFGAVGQATAELCFNTAITGYQEILTDPSYADQIVAFTFPHVGNVGATAEDEETSTPFAKGLVVREHPTAPSNWRAQESLDAWMRARGLIGVSGVDTRRLTRRIRTLGMPHVALIHEPSARFDLDALQAEAARFPSLEGRDLAQNVGLRQTALWSEGRWDWPSGFDAAPARRRKVVAIDYGAKRNILRCLATAGADVIVVPPDTDAAAILAHRPDGVFLSNGPGDPAATARYAGPVIQALLDADLPLFGICLGHQMLALALGAQTKKMSMGHHGANHPVKELATGKVEVTSMNHGFSVDADSLPDGVVETHVSLFDGSNCGIAMVDRPVFSVQHHPEASPGPQDSHYLFDRFIAAMDARVGQGVPTEARANARLNAS
ncbi:MAG: glutamine-hydrolyzing carbamoyl-phosphate synthase small subunit [Pseudomonadota bacterium]